MARGASISNRLAAAQEGVQYRKELDARIVEQDSQQSKVYRVHTEDFANVPQIVSRYFDGFNLSYTEDYWKGVAEHSLTVEIIGTNADSRKVAELAEEIRRTNAQQAVIVTAADVLATFVD